MELSWLAILATRFGQADPARCNHSVEVVVSGFRLTKGGLLVLNRSVAASRRLVLPADVVLQRISVST